MKAPIAAVRSFTEWKVPRRMAWRVRMPKNLDHVQPGAAGRGEVQRDPRVVAQPGLYGGVLVRGVVPPENSAWKKLTEPPENSAWSK
jgi:hypothetical protein